MAAKKRPLTIFLCYAHADAKKVRDLYDQLKRDGLNVWLDKARLIPGQDWEREIRKAVRERDVVIVFHSKQFSQDGFHEKEVKTALEEVRLHPKGKIFIIPARLEACEVLEDLGHLQPVDLFEKTNYDGFEYDGYEGLLSALRQHAQDIGASLGLKRRRLPKISSFPPRNEQLVPDFLLKQLLLRYGMVASPFERTSPHSFPSYPEGAVRPDQWEFFCRPIPLSAHCPTAEDAQALAYLLRTECLPLEQDHSRVGVNRHIFPIWVWLPQATRIQPPLLTLARSAAWTWLDILPAQPQALLDLPTWAQNALLGLLCWSPGSKRALVNLVQLNGVPDDENALILTRKISEFESEFSLTDVPQDDTLLSWLRIRPFGMDQTYLIIPGDDLLPIAPAWWLEQFDSLISSLFLDGIVTKMFASSSRSTSLSLEEMELSWSEKWLSRSLDGQFGAVMHPEEKSMGKIIRFHELFGPGVTEEDTTERLISASQFSLARMLVLGNRLLQNHCWKRFSETSLSLEELDDILKKT